MAAGENPKSRIGDSRDIIAMLQQRGAIPPQQHHAANLSLA
jgi:hypothetical protein